MIQGGSFMRTKLKTTALALFLGLTLFFPKNISAEEVVKLGSDNIVSPRAPGDYNSYSTTTKVGSPGTTALIFLAYHPLTPNWSLASQYTETTSQSYTLGFSVLPVNGQYGGVNINGSVSLSRGMSVTMPADPKRPSKIGLYAKVSYQRVLIRNYSSGKLVKEYYINQGTVVPGTLTQKPVYQ